MSVKKQLIKLGSEQPELRKNIKPILDRLSFYLDPNQAYYADMMDVVQDLGIAYSRLEQADTHASVEVGNFEWGELFDHLESKGYDVISERPNKVTFGTALRHVLAGRVTIEKKGGRVFLRVSNK